MDRFYLENADLYRKLLKTVNVNAPTSQTGEVIMSRAHGNMIASARIRPLLNEEVQTGFPCAVFPRRSPDGERGVVDIHDLYNHPRSRPIIKSSKYQIDKVFDSEVTTEEVYKDLVADLIPFAWNGGVGTLFAYGQTGSGKTFTISQLQELVAASLMSESLQGTKKVYLTIIDMAGNSASDLLNSRRSVSILEDALGNTHLKDAKEHLVEDSDQMIELIRRAASFRQTAATLKNDASSRSHGICRIRINNSATELDGYLYLVDLAGSEIARDVAVHGADRMRETREINISLSVLKDCIRGKAESDLVNSNAHPRSKKSKARIPYRQSALTKVLKHVFDPVVGQTCKTVVIACVNPSLADVGASKNTLRYAEMLHVSVPVSAQTNEKELSKKRLDATHENREPSTAQANLSTTGTFEVANPYGFSSGVLSSRITDPTAAEVPFRNRVRPGMVVSLLQHLDIDAGPAKHNDLMIVIVLGRVDGESRKAVTMPAGNLVERKMGKNNDNKSMSGEKLDSSYLCALVSPGDMANSYEVKLWQQIIIEESMMDKEIVLMYDQTTRYYRILGE